MKPSAAAFASVALLLAPACGGGSPAASSSPTPAATPGASASPSAPAATTSESLTFTGPVAGSMPNAATTCKLLQNGSQLGMTFQGNVGSQQAMLTIQVNAGYHGPGAYAVGAPIDGGANIELSTSSYAGASASNAGNLIVNPDGKSGIVNADLSGGEHVAGNYACESVSS